MPSPKSDAKRSGHMPESRDRRRVGRLIARPPRPRLQKRIMKNEIIRIGQVEINFLLEGADTKGAVALFEFTVPAGARVPAPHSHAHYDETIYGVEGVRTFIVEGKTVPVGRGESCVIRRGDIHGFKNLQSVAAKGLAVVTPALIGPEFFREMAAIVNVGGPPDLATMKETMLRHGLVPAPMETLTANS